MTPEMSRRKALAGAAGLAGMAALAGCTASEEQQEYAAFAVEQAQTEPPLPPSGTPENAYWTFVVESLAWQNQQAQAQTQALAALLEENGLTGDGDGS